MKQSPRYSLEQGQDTLEGQDEQMNNTWVLHFATPLFAQYNATRLADIFHVSYLE